MKQALVEQLDVVKQKRQMTFLLIANEAACGEGHAQTLCPKAKIRGSWDQNAQDHPGAK